MNNLQRALIIVAIVSGLSGSAIAFSSSAAYQRPAMRNAGFNAQQVEPSETQKLLQAAYQLAQQGKFDEALANCFKAIELSPDDPRPHIITGLVYASAMKLKSASESFGKAIQLKPQARLKELYLLKAEVDVRRGAQDEGIAAARKALELDPNYAEAYALIGEALRWDEKRRPEAIAAFRSAIRLKPELLPAYETLGQLLQENKDEKGAEEVLRQALAADPIQTSGRFVLGRMLVKQGRRAEARELWEGRKSDEDRTFPQFIELLKRAENLKQATDALAQKPNDPAALTDMGNAVMEGDHWVVDKRQERAIVYFRKALKVNPTYARAQQGIVKAYIQTSATFGDEKKKLDQEMAVLRKLDPALAAEMEEYRKNYKSGITVTSPVKIDQ